MIDTLQAIVYFLLAGMFGVLLHGAWLLVKDSALKHNIRRDLREKYPSLSREEIRILSYLKIKEMWEKGDVK
tara:strand:- start:231 stop:446 length:216 start_codon:yes stop_codon:yes gene_type:complete